MRILTEETKSKIHAYEGKFRDGAGNLIPRDDDGNIIKCPCGSDYDRANVLESEAKYLHNKEPNLWPVVLAGAVMYLGLIGGIVKSSIDHRNNNGETYIKRYSIESHGQSYDTLTTLIDVDKDGTPDIARKNYHIFGNTGDTNRKCTTEEIDWFINRNKENGKIIPKEVRYNGR